MTNLLLKFVVTLEEYDPGLPCQNHGPLFHRWLPDGRQDSMVLDTGAPDARLEVWFERRGFVDGDFITFHYERREVDPEIMLKQAVLDAGPLVGLLEIQGLTEKQIRSIREGKTGDATYIAFGKTVVKDLLFPPISRLINLLRVYYGQHWIREYDRWDSRKESLGSYCRNIRLQWSLDEGNTWASFIPNETEVQLTLTLPVRRAFREYLTEEDWQEIGQVFRTDYEPSIAAFALARTHQLFDRGNLEYALVEGVMALELAVKEFLRRKLDGNDYLCEKIKAFWNLNLRSQVISVAAATGQVSSEDLECTIKAVDTRNKLVHEGKNPPHDVEVQLTGLLNTVASLLSGPAFRFPSANPGNVIRSPEQWDQLDKESEEDATTSD